MDTIIQLDTPKTILGYLRPESAERRVVVKAGQKWNIRCGIDLIVLVLITDGCCMLQ